MIAPQGRWQPGIGDPTAMGWATIAAYLAAAALCGLCARREAGGARRASLFWLILALAMLLLGVNKELDLQSWFTQVARDFVISQGWYEARRTLQRLFMAVLALTSVLALAELHRRFRNLGGAARIAMLGIVLIAVFVILRAASFHRFDDLLRSEFAGLRGNWILELGGIAVVAAGAATRLLGSRRRGAQPPQSGQRQSPGKDRRS